MANRWRQWIAMCLLGCWPVLALLAEERILYVDVRNRPPEMVVEDGRYSGPLLETIQLAASRIGRKVIFVERRFERSLDLLVQRKGNLDIVPRVLRTPERDRLMDFLGPIGAIDSEIVFLVKPGQQQAIRRFEDLERRSLGVKAGSSYFERFDQNDNIRKIAGADDDNLVRMFQAGRFDTMIVLDQGALEVALRKHGVSDYAFAEYRHPQRLYFYYAMAKEHPDRPALQQALETMSRSGEIREIFRKAGVKISQPRP